jgi:hypothetical protein
MSRPFHVTTNAAVSRLERGIHGSFELFGVDLWRKRLLRQHVAYRPRLGRGIGQSAFHVDGIKIHGALPDRERDATLAAEILGCPGHSIRKGDMNRLVGAIDDRLAELRSLCVGRREKPDIFRREVGRKAGHEYSRAHDLRKSGGMMRQGIAWRRHIWRIELEQFRAGDERVFGGESLRGRYRNRESHRNRRQNILIHDCPRDER